MLRPNNSHSVRYRRSIQQISSNVSDSSDMQQYMNNLRLRGYLILFATWLTFVAGLGSVFGLWTWCFNKLDGSFLKAFNIPLLSPVINYLVDAFSEKMVIDDYYSFSFFLNFVIIWIWCLISWIGMKLFRHSKGGGS
ncbi:DEKNAAC105063 [Brettanomyces naardenensis]|uniref:DEKNAAC105063 n=1 Tax=Brettanomyces naardenensis TaxID=13370 RepID=A0A448YSC8_BRENA|nr:DEKNAAC105063 [Brettanomyces naardenensis]